MSWINRNRVRSMFLTIGLALCGLQSAADAATKVAVIDGGGAASWCSFLTSNGYECTIFPATGPTQSLDPFQIIVDTSDVWSDPNDLLAAQMQTGKCVVIWGAAPVALQLSTKPLVKSWIGADAPAGGSDHLLTTATDPILGSRPPGTEIADSNDAGGYAVGGTEGYPDSKVLARWQNGNFVGLLRNTWQGGRSVYLTDYLHPGSQPDIFLNLFRELSRSIPASSMWGLAVLALGLLILASLLLKRSRSSLHRRSHGMMCLLLGSLLGTGAYAQTSPAEQVLVVQHNESVTTFQLGTGAIFYQTDQDVTNARMIEVQSSPSRLILWNQTRGQSSPVPYYAISLDGLEVQYVTSTSYRIHLRGIDFDPLDSAPIVSPALTAGSDTNLYIVQFWTQRLSEFQDALNAAGAMVLHNLPMNAAIVRMSESARDQVNLFPIVRWIGPFHPQYRLDATLVNDVASESGSALERVCTISTIDNDMIHKTEIKQALENLGVLVEFVDSAAPYLYARLTTAQLRDAARFDQVLFIGLRGGVGSDMDTVRDLSGAKYIAEIPGGFSGEGVRGEVMDDGLCTDPGVQCCIAHGATCDASNYCSTHSAFVPAPARHGALYQDLCTHGTPVYGIVFGNGNGDSKGIALLPARGADGAGFFASNYPFGSPPTSSR